MSDPGSRRGGNPRKRRLPDPPDPDDPARAVDPRPLAGLLDALATRRGWGQRLSGARVHALWEQIAGAELARHTEPVRLHGGVLVLRVDSPAWATQVRYLTGGLLTRANEVLGAGSVQRITLVTGPLREEQ